MAVIVQSSTTKPPTAAELKQAELLKKYGIPDIDRSKMPAIGSSVSADYFSSPAWQAYQTDILKQKKEQQQALIDAMMKAGEIPTLMPISGGEARLPTGAEQMIQQNMMEMLTRKAGANQMAMDALVAQNVARQQEQQGQAMARFQAARQAAAKAQPMALPTGGFRSRFTGVPTRQPTSLSDILASASGDDTQNVFGLRELYRTSTPIGGIRAGVADK